MPVGRSKETSQAVTPCSIKGIFISSDSLSGKSKFQQDKEYNSSGSSPDKRTDLLVQVQLTFSDNICISINRCGSHPKRCLSKAYQEELSNKLYNK